MTDKLKDLQWACEEKMASKCYRDQYIAEKEGTEHKCVCELPDDWTEEECLEFLGRKK